MTEHTYKPAPAPALIDGEEWMVRDSGDKRVAHVDFDSMVMTVPMHDDEDARIVRAHEATHIKISPRDEAEYRRLNAEGIPNRTMQCVEDARVYSSMKRSGIEASEVCLWPAEELQGFATSASRLEQARCLVATRGTGDRAVLESLCDSGLVELVNSVIEPTFSAAESKGEIPTWEDNLRLCKELHEALVDSEQNTTTSQPSPAGEPGANHEPQQSSQTATERELERESFGGDQVKSPTDKYDLDKNQTTKIPDFTEEELEDLRMGGFPQSNGCRGVPGTMGMFPVKLTERLPVKDGFGRKHRSTDVGAVPRNIHRVTIDQKVFSKVKREGTATILIDCSGSMQLQDADVLALLKVAPSATIAAYAGRRNALPLKPDGRLAIIASNRKAVNGDELARFRAGHGENVIDYPALEWLSKQKGPRLWVCDGRVTGRSTGGGVDHHTPSWTVKISRLVRRAGIIRIESIHAAQEMLSNPRKLRGEKKAVSW